MGLLDLSLPLSLFRSSRRRSCASNVWPWVLHPEPASPIARGHSILEIAGRLVLAVVQLPLLVCRFRGWGWGIIRSFSFPLLCFAVSIWQDDFKPLTPCSSCTRAMLSASRCRNQASKNCCCPGVNFTTPLVGHLSLVLDHSPSREFSDARAIHSGRCLQVHFP